MNGDTYVIPATAEPYLGRYLDVGLFDVTTLTAAGFSERIPLRITFDPGTRPSLPGVTITSSSGGSATGYVTRTSARVFGAALADQAVSDSLAGWPASSAVFGSVTGISLDLPVDPVVTPHFPQTTVVLKGISNDGGPMRFGFGVLVNMEDGRKFAGFVFMVGGEARASVPLGTYLALFDDVTFSADGSLTVRQVVASDIAVTGSQPAIMIDARRATAVASETTPKPATAQDLSTELFVQDESRHFGLGWGWDIGLPGARYRVTPTDPPTVGTLRQDTRWTAIDPSTPGGRYLFDASFTDRGIPADQAREIPAVTQAAVVRNVFDSDRLLGAAGAGRFVFLPGSFFASATYWQTPTPLDRTEYVYAPHGSVMQGLALANGYASDPGFVDGDYVKVIAGNSSVDRWFRNPYVLAVPEFDPQDGGACLACTSRDRMTFAFGVHDGNPAHQVEVYGDRKGKPVAVFDVYRDGELLLHKLDRLGAVFRIPSGDATYRVVDTLSRRLTGSILSTSITTDVTFRSAQGVAAPSSFYCYTGGVCTIMPVLTATLDLHATSLGTIPLGTASFDIATGHIAGSKQLPISSVTAQWRRSGTGTWHDMPVIDIGSGQSRAAFKAMAWMDQRRFDLRVTVTDTKGGVLVQTTDSAFLVSR